MSQTHTIVVPDGRLYGLVRDSVTRHVQGLVWNGHPYPDWTLDSEHTGQQVTITITVTPRTDLDR